MQHRVIEHGPFWWVHSMNRQLFFGWVVSLLLFGSIPFALALGLTFPFFGSSVEVYEGETTVVTFILQNMVGEKDINVRVQVLEGQEVAQLIDGKEVYLVPFGRKDIPINLQLKAPENPKDVYPVRFSVTTLPEEGGRQVELAVGLEKRLEVTVQKGKRPVAQVVQTEAVPQPVVEQPLRREGATLMEEARNAVIIVLVVVILIVLYRIVKKHKDKLEKERGRYDL